MIRILLSKKLGELKWTQADLARATPRVRNRTGFEKPATESKVGI